MVLKRDGNEGCKAISAKTFKDWEMKKWTAKHFNCYLQVLWMGLLLMIDPFFFNFVTGIWFVNKRNMYIDIL